MPLDHCYKIAYVMLINKLKQFCAYLMTKSMVINNLNWDNGKFGNPNFPIINI